MPFEKYKGPVDPPDEAYGRVTNPERFRPLHDAMLEMLDALQGRFDVERVEGYDLDKELERFSRQPTVRPAITLKPRHPESAPITVIFTDFPGLHIRFGRWFTDSFPSCGCDACDESADGEMERAAELVDSVTDGGFRETVVHSPIPRTSVIGEICRRVFILPIKGCLRRGPREAALRGRVARYSPQGVGDMPRKNFARLRGRAMRGSRRVTEFRGPSLKMTNTKPLNDARALELTGGQPSLDLDWKPWPEHPRTGE